MDSGVTYCAMKNLVFALSIPLLAGVMPQQAADAESDIKSVLNVQVEAWNRGDIPRFVQTYAPDATFVGKQVTHGRDGVQARYEKNYPTREAMGHLSFSDLQVHLLTPDVAIVTGGWHLQRSGSGGEPVGGIFSLVLQRHGGRWEIELDHTS